MKGSLWSVVAKVLNYEIVVSEFEIQSRYYVHFQINNYGKDITPNQPISELNSTATVLLKFDFGIK